MTYQPKPKVRCYQCGDLMSPRGPKPASGRYFCSKPECVQTRRAEHYRAKVQADRRADAPTRCSCCDDPLPPRKVRRGDSPTGGRWCQRARCRQHRDLVESQFVAGAARSSEPDPVTTEFCADATKKYLRTTCPKCGLLEAIQGWVHQRADGQACWELDPSQKKPNPNIVATVMPDSWRKYTEEI